jgi:hypothetical protein
MPHSCRTNTQHNEFPGPLTTRTRWHANTQLCTPARTTGSSNFESFFKTPLALTPDNILSVSENVMTYALVCLTVRYHCTGVSPHHCTCVSPPLLHLLHWRVAPLVPDHHTRTYACTHTRTHTDNRSFSPTVFILFGGYICEIFTDFFTNFCSGLYKG